MSAALTSRVRSPHDELELAAKRDPIVALSFLTHNPPQDLIWKRFFFFSFCHTQIYVHPVIIQEEENYLPSGYVLLE